MTGRTLVWDASALVHAHFIERLDVLGDLAKGASDEPWQNVTTAAIVEELNHHGGQIPDWLDIVHVDGLEELLFLGKWVRLVASDTHSKGEATVLAWAECHGALPVIDDAGARRVAAASGLRVHGVLWVGAQAVNHGRWTKTAVSNFFDLMKAGGASYPFETGGYVPWATSHGLLPG